jgi:glucans biosynthesis protein C
MRGLSSEVVMSASSDFKRMHALDALRAAMMLLGLVLHSAVSFVITPLGASWPYQDRQTSGVFDWLAFVIHLFRMPTFFVMAGFFAAFLYYREGTFGFLAHRFRRLVLPLVAAWIVVFPIVEGGFVFANSGGGRAGFETALGAMQLAPYENRSLAHLWFIYYLIIFCAAATVVVPLVERTLSETVRARALALFARVVPTWTGCLLLGVLMAITLLPMAQPALETSITFIPLLRVLVAYSVFFSVGWLIFAQRDLVASFGRRPWRFFSAGLVMSVVYLIAVLQPPVSDRVLRHLIAVVAAGIATWLLIYGITGLFVHYFESPRPVQRYLSDASYWMYLIHLPFAIWIPGLLAPFALPAVVKFVIVLGGMTLITVTTYHFFVRSTAIGAFLNGRRFERGLPRVEVTRAAVPAEQ